jgi:hypothetical protein
MLSALCFLIGLVLSIGVLAADWDVEAAWFGVFLFAGLLLGCLPLGPPVPAWPARRTE